MRGQQGTTCHSPVPGRSSGQSHWGLLTWNHKLKCLCQRLFDVNGLVCTLTGSGGDCREGGRHMLSSHKAASAQLPPSLARRKCRSHAVRRSEVPKKVKMLIFMRNLWISWSRILIKRKKVRWAPTKKSKTNKIKPTSMYQIQMKSN